MKRKVSGTKAELQGRLQDRGQGIKGQAIAVSRGHLAFLRLSSCWTVGLRVALKLFKEVFEKNDRGWARSCTPTFSTGTYLASGSFRDVYMVTYLKGPRKNLKGVYKLFKDPKAEKLIQEEMKTVEEAGRIIKAFNEQLGAADRAFGGSFCVESQ